MIFVFPCSYFIVCQFKLKPTARRRAWPISCTEVCYKGYTMDAERACRAVCCCRRWNIPHVNQGQSTGLFWLGNLLMYVSSGVVFSWLNCYVKNIVYIERQISSSFVDKSANRPCRMKYIRNKNDEAWFIYYYQYNYIILATINVQTNLHIFDNYINIVTYIVPKTL